MTPVEAHWIIWLHYIFFFQWALFYGNGSRAFYLNVNFHWVISFGGTTNLYLAPIQSNLRPKFADSILNPSKKLHFNPSISRFVVPHIFLANNKTVLFKRSPIQRYKADITTLSLFFQQWVRFRKGRQASEWITTLNLSLVIYPGHYNVLTKC